MWFYAILIVTWMEMNFLTALKDYKVLVCDFAVSLGTGLLLALFFGSVPAGQYRYFVSLRNFGLWTFDDTLFPPAVEIFSQQ